MVQVAESETKTTHYNRDMVMKNHLSNIKRSEVAVKVDRHCSSLWYTRGNT